MVYSIKEIAVKMNLEERTLKYYAKENLLPLVETTASGHLKFQDRDFEWLELLASLRETGASLSELKEFADVYYRVVTSERPNPVMLYQMLSVHMERAEKTLRKFEQNLNHLTDFIEKTGDGRFLQVGGQEDNRAVEQRNARNAMLAQNLRDRLK